MSAVALPPNWEAKFDAKNNRYYFIDHVTKKTQWDDPRFNHPSVWSGAFSHRTQMLESFKDVYIDAPETVVRRILVRANFDEAKAQSQLAADGYRQHTRVTSAASSTPRRSSAAQSPRSAQTATTPRARAASPAATAATAAAATDEFSIMYLRGRFAAVSDAAIRDVLVNCGGDTEKTAEKLSSMGYEDRQAAEQLAAREHIEQQMRAQSAADAKRRQQEERGRMSARLEVEFPAAASAAVRQLLEYCDFDYDAARKQLQAADERDKLVQDFADLAESTVDRALDAAGRDLVQARVTLDDLRQKERAKSAERRQQGSRAASAKPKSTAAPSRVKQSPPPSSSSARSQSARRSPQQQPAHQTIAKGPNAALCLGSNPELRMWVYADSAGEQWRARFRGSGTLAVGANPANRVGPSAANCESAEFRRPASSIATAV